MDAGVNALFDAVKASNLEAVKQLINQGVLDLVVDDEETEGLAPLHLVTSPHVAYALLSAGQDPNTRTWDGDTPLHSAARKDDPELVRLLCAFGADVDAQDNTGSTPLHDVSSAKIAQWLLHFGANVNAEDYGEQTPIFNASSVEIAAVLVEAGADLSHEAGLDVLEYFGINDCPDDMYEYLCMAVEQDKSRREAKALEETTPTATSINTPSRRL